jgi:hypothetical protein
LLGVADVVAALDCTLVPSVVLPKAFLIHSFFFFSCLVVKVEFVLKHLGGLGASIVLNCVNVPGSEVSSIISTREGGTLAFVSLETSFARGVLGTRSLGIPSFLPSSRI